MPETTLDVNVNYQNLDSQTAAATSSVDDLASALNETTSASKRLGDEGVKSQKEIKSATQGTTQSTEEATKSIKKYGDNLKKTNKDLRAGTRNLRELREAAASLEEEFENASFGSDEYDRLKRDLIEVNREIKNTELSIEALDSEQVASEIGGLVGGLTDVATGAVLAFGVSEESAEDFLQTLAQVEGAGRLVKGSIEGAQAGIKLYNNVVKNSALFTRLAAVAQGAYSLVVGTSTGALKLFRIALASTGIGLLVIGLGLLIANFDKVKVVIGNVLRIAFFPWIKAIEFLGDQFGGLGDIFSDFIDQASDLIGIDIGGALNDVGKALGLVSDKTVELTEAQKEQEATQRRQNRLLTEAIELGKEELETANVLLGAISNQTISKEKQTEAYNRLNQLYPDIIGNYESEEELLANIDEAQNAITESIARQTIERLKAAKIAELQEKVFAGQLAAAREARDDAGTIDTGLDFDINIDAIVGESAQEQLRTLDEDLAAIEGDLLQIFQSVNDGLDLETTSAERVVDTLDALDTKFSESDARAKKAIDDRKKFIDELTKLEDQLEKQASSAETALLSGEDRVNQELENSLLAVDLLGEQLLEARRRVNGEEAQLTQEQLEQLDSLRVKAETEAANKIADIRIKSRREQLSTESEIISQQIEQLENLAEAEIARIPEDTLEEDRLLKELEIKRDLLQQTLDLQDSEFENKQRLLQAELDSVEQLKDAESQLRAQALQERIETNQTEQELNRVNVQNQVQEIERSIQELNQAEPFSLRKLLGVTEDELDFVKEQFGSLISEIASGISDVTQAQIDENGRLIDAINSRITETESALQREIELNQQGFASNVEGKRQELAALQAQREEALRQQEALQQKQARLQQAEIIAESAVQTANLITAASTLIKEGSKFFPVGLALAAGLIATLFGTFARIKSQASQATVPQFRRGGGLALSGASHEQGGIGLFDSVSGNKLAEFEGGEYLYVVNKESTKKHLPLLRAINGGNQSDIEKVVGMRQLNFSRMQVPQFIGVSSTNKGVEDRIDKLSDRFSKLADYVENKPELIDMGKYYIMIQGNVSKKIWKENA